jgi:hypothetical protein
MADPAEILNKPKNPLARARACDNPDDSTSLGHEGRFGA